MAEYEWTPLIGIRNVSLRFLLRGVVAAALWTPAVWFVTPGMNALPAHWAVWAVVGFILVVVGFAIGYGLCRGSSDSAGFSGPVLTVLALIFIALTCGGSVLIAEALRPVEQWQRFFLMAGPAFGAAIFAYKETWIDA